MVINMIINVMERHAVVYGDEDRSVLQFSDPLEFSENPPAARIEPPNLDGVIKQVASDDRRVGK